MHVYLPQCTGPQHILLDMSKCSSRHNWYIGNWHRRHSIHDIHLCLKKTKCVMCSTYYD